MAPVGCTAMDVYRATLSVMFDGTSGALSQSPDSYCSVANTNSLAAFIAFPSAAGSRRRAARPSAHVACG